MKTIDIIEPFDPFDLDDWPASDSYSFASLNWCAGRKRQPPELKQFRREVSVCWLPHTGRKFLKTYERKLIEQWFARGLASTTIAKAIHRCTQRLKSQSKPAYSLGIIRSDLEAVLAEEARMMVGRDRSQLALDPPGWRDDYNEALTDIANAECDPERATMYRELRDSLDKITRAEAESRFLKIRG